ncbi:chemotaxis-specific protein-glutamate methyltransferase CheB [Roseisolibacter agri]|uniref:Protein-glutamate methylesterase/protein-glutamine glutaminase n=1 Tax=Roseisolibacter agri TaxID=2014610 RepID=A0AA37VBI4_9BACT|nr:chemotaxis-specific protein-glutamate methyltransferase CheB [Roseisolibacter agri]GLC26473.1 chemotaxis response regulator protein-glutamate methylesterase [Roseisolibacter agri]
MSALRSPKAAPAPRTVLVVDDSAFMRRVVAEMVGECEGFRVVGTARDGEEALRLVHALRPDVVTLDVAMPGLDGLQVLGYVMSETPRPVVVLSGLGEDGLALRALELGAVDFVPKPSGPISLDVVAVRDRLHDALRAAAVADVSRLDVVARAAQERAPSPAPAAAAPAERAVVVAASTGGPNALTQLLPRLPRTLGAAVLVAQHMPAGFTESLARRLAARSALPVLEAEHDAPVLAEHVYVAPGGRHLRVLRDAAGVVRLSLDDGPAVWGVRPSADLLFASAASTFGGATLGVVLTGMGRDGADGLLAVRRAGGRAIVQARETAVVPGMPDSALARAGADVVAPLDALAAAVVAQLGELA